jgi:hypothetical protein
MNKMNNQLKTLAVTDNVSESFQANGTTAAVRVTTSEASTITVERSIVNADFVAVPDLSWSIDGTDEFNVVDLVEGQFLRVKATAGVMTAVKVLG